MYVVSNRDFRASCLHLAHEIPDAYLYGHVVEYDGTRKRMHVEFYHLTS